MNTPHIRVRFVDSHPWAGHTGTVVRVGNTISGRRPIVRLDPGPNVPCGHECFIMAASDVVVVAADAIGASSDKSQAASSAKCPRCDRVSHTPAGGKDQWYCHNCRMAFEAIDDGIVGYKSQERTIEKAEQYKAILRRKQAQRQAQARPRLRGGLGR